MPKPPPPRPEADFRITVFSWEVDNELNHRNAGFPGIPQDVLTRRFFQFLDFLQANGMTTRTIAKTEGDVSLKSELRNSDLTDDGYKFAQRFHGRWLDRTHKDTGRVGEQNFLQKWHKQLSAGAQ